ncbi:MAG: acylphosphatase [Ruminococcus sp.]|nr:acylphosphatase [Ruminococcus sp.]
MAEKIRRHIVFYGSVQGVGFRYRAYYAARANGVSGWIRNRFDGAVEAELEGEERSIDEVIMAVERGTFISIERMEARTVPLHGDYGFEIRD